MRKNFLLLSLALLSAMGASAAYDFEANGIYYKVNPNDPTKVSVAFGEYLSQEEMEGCYTGTVIIPATVKDDNHNVYDVTAIDDGAFRRSHGLTKVTIPTSVTELGPMAFYFCESLTDLTIPDSVTEIGEYAFGLCEKLKTVHLSTSLKTIGERAFYQCTSLTQLEIPESLENLGEGITAGCNNLAKFTGKYATEDGRFLIVDKVLMAYASYGQTVLDIPSAATEIGPYAISELTNIKDVNIPYQITKIGTFAFLKCTNLIEVNIDRYLSRLSVIDDFAFQGCSKLAYARLPYSVTYIGREAYGDCTHLNSVNIYNDNPNTIATGYSPFSGRNLKEVILYVPKGATRFFETMNQWSGFQEIKEMDMDYDFLEIINNDHRMYFNYNDDGSTATVTGRSQWNNSYDGDIIIPSTINHDGVDYTVTVIGENAFASCGNLSSVTIPNTVTELERYSMCYTNLKSLTLPASVTKIGDGAFQESDELETFTLENDDPANIEIDSEAFFEVPIENVILYVPGGSKAKYEKAPIWKDFKKIVEKGSSAIEEVTLGTETNADNTYYDLMGRRVQNPTRGIYIQNGRKVLL